MKRRCIFCRNKRTAIPCSAKNCNVPMCRSCCSQVLIFEEGLVLPMCENCKKASINSQLKFSAEKSFDDEIKKQWMVDHLKPQALYAGLSLFFKNKFFNERNKNKQ